MNLNETIQRALEAATPGNWTVTKSYTGIVVRSDNPFYPVCKMFDSEITPDAHLIANAPEWLRALLEENERLKEENQ